jgi:methyl-accepting chemotaxis protein
MNKDRRKALEAIKTSIEKWVSAFEMNVDSDALSDLHTDLTDIQGDEQEYFDNMPEGLQGGDKGSAAESAIEALQEAMDKLDEVMDAINQITSDLDEVVGRIDDAVAE